MKTRDEHLALIRQHSHRIDPLPTGETALLRKLHNIEAVLFDVYGTLFVSASGELGTSQDTSDADAFCQALADVGLSCRDDGTDGIRCLHDTIRALQERCRQSGVDSPEVDILEVWRATLGALTNRGLLTEPTDEVDVATLSLSYELRTNPVWPMPDAARCLTELAGRGVQLGLVSNCQWFTALLFSALLGGEPEAFGIATDLQFSSYRCGQAKPGDYLFRQAAESMGARGIQPEHVLHVGNDMLNDVLPAAKMGFLTALFAGDERSLRRRTDDPRVKSVAPDIVIVQLRDLLSCVRPEQQSQGN